MHSAKREKKVPRPGRGGLERNLGNLGGFFRELRPLLSLLLEEEGYCNKIALLPSSPAVFNFYALWGPQWTGGVWSAARIRTADLLCGDRVRRGKLDGLGGVHRTQTDVAVFRRTADRWAVVLDHRSIEASDGQEGDLG